MLSRASQNKFQSTQRTKMAKASLWADKTTVKNIIFFATSPESLTLIKIGAAQMT
jgi:hypothetical protein